MVEKRNVGWREWVALPSLDTDWIKAKVDTGARSSSLHADDIEIIDGPEGQIVEFSISPWQRSSMDTVRVKAPLLDWRSVRSSSGESEERPTILTPVRVRKRNVKIELTLSNRDQMGFRMLLGREALRGRFLVDSGRSYLGPKPSRDIRSRNREFDEEE